MEQNTIIFGVKFHKTRHFDMSRHPCTTVKHCNHSIHQRDNNFGALKMIMCLYIDNDNITKYNNNVQNPNHDAVIKQLKKTRATTCST